MYGHTFTTDSLDQIKLEVAQQLNDTRSTLQKAISKHPSVIIDDN